MIQPFLLFAKQVLSSTGFQVSQLSKKNYQALLTAFQGMFKHDLVMLEPLIDLVKQAGAGVLVIDDTSNPKYGLKRWTKNMKHPSTNGFEWGYKILLFLWECPLGRIPIGFALWHQQSPSLTDLTLKGLSLLRNRYDLKPEAVLADGAFAIDAPLKRVTDYGWPLVMRFKRNRKFEKQRMDKLIPRGYGSVTGKLKNGTKVKVFRRKDRFFVCNRMLWEVEKAISLYKRRWRIEETFRAVKTCLSLKGCQQHSMQAQALYLFCVFLLFACLELVSDQSFYKTFQNVISGKLPLENILDHRVFGSC